MMATTVTVSRGIGALLPKSVAYPQGGVAKAFATLFAEVWQSVAKSSPHDGRV